MSLVKFKKSNPFGNLVTSDLFKPNDFFGNGFWNQGILNDSFWNGKKLEPALNIKENEGDYEIELAAPGFAKKDFKVTIDDECLNISAKKTSEEEEEEENYARREFSYNAFERTLQLPENIKEEEIKARYHDGILRFKLQKKEVVKKAET
ncbi:Hsp20/alpha crystallin family protein [Maribacter aquimaris]|uniref:Hsp20/alpha crystallin family protein n=1 Tax=Maribacter aquimaris TaxID=2737171 RepID=UPI001CB712A1|nr:Hsp20/alpha crystallin family protein [Maribacter aquimaris]